MDEVHKVVKVMGKARYVRKPTSSGYLIMREKLGVTRNGHNCFQCRNASKSSKKRAVSAARLLKNGDALLV